MEFYELSRSHLRGLDPKRYRKLLDLMRSIEQLPIHEGTAPLPRDWRKSFPT